MKSKDQVRPENKWKFDDEVSNSFDDMLERSIPQYDVMRKTVVDVASKFQKDNNCILDLGTSLGESLAFLLKRFQKRNQYIGLEISESMLEKANKRFEREIQEGYVIIKKHDLRKGIPLQGGVCIALSVLTIQFTPIEYRPHIINSVYECLIKGGVFILVEKVLGQTNTTDSLMTKLYYDMKGNNGYSQEQIERKRLSLEGVLVPVTAKWNEELLYNAGFKDVECFWRWMNFAGWLGVKR